MYAGICLASCTIFHWVIYFLWIFWRCNLDTRLLWVDVDGTLLILLSKTIEDGNARIHCGRKQYDALCAVQREWGVTGWGQPGSRRAMGPVPTCLMGW